VLYTLKRTPDGLEGPIGKRVYATFESHEALFIWLRHEADKRGYGHKQTVFLADGSDTIWRLQEKYFAEAEVCLDWYHVVEKLWTAGGCFHSEGSQELKDWIALQTKKLRNGAASAIIAGLREELAKIPKTGPGNKGKRERLEEIIEHLAKNHHRLRYKEMRSRDLDIGTVVQSRAPSETSYACDSTAPVCAGAADAPNAFCIFAASCSMGSGPTSQLTSPVDAISSSPPNQSPLKPTTQRRRRECQPTSCNARSAPNRNAA